MLSDDGFFLEEDTSPPRSGTKPAPRSTGCCVAAALAFVLSVCAGENQRPDGTNVFSTSLQLKPDETTFQGLLQMRHDQRSQGSVSGGCLLFLRLSAPGRDLLPELGTVSSVFGLKKNLKPIKEEKEKSRLDTPLLKSERNG